MSTKLLKRLIAIFALTVLIAGCISMDDDDYELSALAKFRTLDDDDQTIVNEDEEGYFLSQCTDGKDNDRDGDVDCDEYVCALEEPTCEDKREITKDACDDGKDNDRDGDTDCEDEDCQVWKHCQDQKLQEETMAYCTDGIDNDFDGDVDCADEDCGVWDFCLEATEEDCNDGEDNDSDGEVDCDDSNCIDWEFCADPAENTAVECKDEEDNDDDGDVDCDDEDCKAWAFCEAPLEATQEECDDGEDNDNDGDTDCDDANCEKWEHCLDKVEASSDQCQDGEDNDDDGFTDCDDSGCSAWDFCTIDPVYENTNALCSNGEDDDGDGATDCDDSDCTYAENCVQPTDDAIDIKPFTFEDGGANIDSLPLIDLDRDLEWVTASEMANQMTGTPISEPISHQVSGAWGGVYAQKGSGTGPDDREPMRVTDFLLKKLKFEVKSNVELMIKVQWCTHLEADSGGDYDCDSNQNLEGAGVNFGIPLKNLNTEIEVDDNEWHSYEVDMIRMVTDIKSADFIVIPFSLWTVTVPDGVSPRIEARNVSLSGTADTECVIIEFADSNTADDNLLDRVFCSKNAHEIYGVEDP